MIKLLFLPAVFSSSYLTVFTRVSASLAGQAMPKENEVGKTNKLKRAPKRWAVPHLEVPSPLSNSTP
jgi:hypothetical protein